MISNKLNMKSTRGNVLQTAETHFTYKHRTKWATKHEWAECVRIDLLFHILKEIMGTPWVPSKGVLLESINTKLCLCPPPPPTIPFNQWGWIFMDYVLVNKICTTFDENWSKRFDVNALECIHNKYFGYQTKLSNLLQYLSPGTLTCRASVLTTPPFLN